MEMYENEEVRSKEHKGFTITVYDPFGLFKVAANAGKTPKSLAENTFTSADQARKFIDAYLLEQSKAQKLPIPKD